jgi:integrase
MLTFNAWQRSSVVEQGTHKPLVGGSNPPAATSSIAVIASEARQSRRIKEAPFTFSRDQGIPPHLLRHTFATLWSKNGGDSLMLQRLLGHTTLMMTNRYCQAIGWLDAVEAHKRYNPVDNFRVK